MYLIPLSNKCLIPTLQQRSKLLSDSNQLCSLRHHHAVEAVYKQLLPIEAAVKLSYYDAKKVWGTGTLKLLCASVAVYVVVFFFPSIWSLSYFLLTLPFIF